MFYPTLVSIHSVFRWLVIAVLLFVIVYTGIQALRGSVFTHRDYRLSAVAMVLCHFQLLFGFSLYFLSPKVVFAASSMESGMLRFFLLEHPLLMVLGIGLVTAGYLRMKKAPLHGRRFQRIFWFYLPGLVLILAGTPWPFHGWGNGWI